MAGQVQLVAWWGWPKWTETEVEKLKYLDKVVGWLRRTPIFYILHTELFEFMKLRNMSNVQKRHYPLLQGNLSNIVSISEWTGGWAEMQQLRRPSLWPGRAGAGQGQTLGRAGQGKLSHTAVPL